MFFKFFFEKILTNDKNWFLKTGNFTFLNSYSYFMLRKKPELLESIDGIYLDGIFISLWVSIFLRKKVARVSFDMSSLAPKVLESVNYNNSSIFFVGAKGSEIEDFVKVIAKHYPQMNIVGYRSGYFKGQERNEFLKSIIEINPDVIIVGMGTPLQEKFIYDLKFHGWQGLAFTCGGFIHQTSKRFIYYPSWVNKLHLRWLYRLYDEPKLIKRFLRSYTIFPFVFFYDYIKYKCV